jgi:hypothetical protein
MKKYLIALSHTKDNFNHPTILVSAKDEVDAISIVKNLKPKEPIGKIKEVFY